jgi:hypothetical protein
MYVSLMKVFHKKVHTFVNKTVSFILQLQRILKFNKCVISGLIVTETKNTSYLL